jgi:PIN domain nuclease of toxin-antitoxin system
VNYLLDTHMLIWWQQDAPELTTQARAIIQNPDNTIFVSSVTVWEIAIKLSLGKINVVFEDMIQAINDDGFQPLVFTYAHAAQIQSLPNVHRDPFDRALIAQAMAEPMYLLTVDTMLGKYGTMVKLV